MEIRLHDQSRPAPFCAALRAGLSALLMLAVTVTMFATYAPSSALAAPRHAHRHVTHRGPHSASHRRSRASASRTHSTATTTTTTTGGPLRFGIYPWGAVGASTSIAPSVPENPTKALAAVQQLRGAHQFVVHVFGDYRDSSTTTADALISEASWWSANGLKVAVVLRYTPTDASWAAGYVPWVRALTRRLVGIAGTVSIQIANEPNNLAAGAGDGSYPGVIGAIASGVPAARAELVAAGRPDVLVGFNWAAGSNPTTTEPMWSQLRQAGGTAFTSAVGFVGVNVYPGTWSPPSSSAVPTSTQIDASIRSTLGAVRSTDMPAAGVGGARIIIGETGYPTTPTRTEATQNTVVQQIVTTVDATKATYGVTDLYLFDLRDGNTASGQLENGYGLMRDDYAAKPAFTTVQHLIATVGV